MFLKLLPLLFLLTACAPIHYSMKNDFEIGVNIHCNPDPNICIIKEMGAEWVRVDMNWCGIEPEQGKWDFNLADAVVDNANKLNLKIYASLICTPKWLSDKSIDVPTQLEWMIFVKKLSERYGDRIAVYGIWNEPNLEEFWSGSSEQYVEILLKPAYPIIKFNAPHSLVAAPELAHLYSARLGIRDFFNSIKTYGGENSFDIISHHLYGDKDFESKIFGYKFLGIQYRQGLLQMLKEDGFGNKRIWITEMGSNVSDSNEEGQALILKRQLILLKSLPLFDKAMIYELGPENNKEQWGLLRLDGSRRPAFNEIQKLMK